LLSLIKPFRALCPRPSFAARVAAPPYDVLTSEEARQRATGNPYSFLRVSKAEIDLPKGTDVHSDTVYRKARENFQRLIEQGVLVRDEVPCFYLYRLTMGQHAQTGLVAVASVEAYDTHRIKRHELTRPDKEDDRVRHMEALNAQTGPVMLAYPNQPEVDAMLASACRTVPDIDIIADTGVHHQLWVVKDGATCDRLGAAFEPMPALYIADGHHRSAAASRVAAAHRRSNPSDHGSHDYFLTVLFPHHALRILGYNRVVTDLNGMSPEVFLDCLRERFDVERSADPVAPYVAGQWYRLRIESSRVPADPVQSLQVSVLTDQILAPVLGIHDLRVDQRIDFVGGIRGLAELERRVNSGEMSAAFSLYPTSMGDLMRVADAGRIMPPKSTWFEPKLADGLVSHVLD
jgi:uncharacterized protein (DUF1015 family)